MKEVKKIKSKYCTKDKVQIMFSNATRQIICSKDGYLYLRDGDDCEVVHKYLDDPIRRKMPYKNKPSSEYHATHLLKYNQIYAKFTNRRAMNPNHFSLMSSLGYHFTFLYMIKNKKKEAIFVELTLDEFEAKEEIFENLTKKDVQDFLYKATGFDGKYVFERYRGIQYAKSYKEKVSIKENFIDLSDEAIIDKYNKIKYSEPIMLVPGFNREEIRKINEEQKAKTIDDVKEFKMTESTSWFGNCTCYMLIVKGDEMYVYEFDIIYVSKNCFKIISKTRNIRISKEMEQEILKMRDIEYTTDPNI